MLEAPDCVRYVLEAPDCVRYVDDALDSVKYKDKSNVAHDAIEPFVVKYFPVLPDCDGSASTVPHSNPVVPELTLRT